MATPPNPLVSVIVCFLDGGEWLPEAVESVFAQSHSQWELILVDDGSQPETSQMALDYAAQFPGKIFYVDHPGHLNRGLTISRNKGASIARGSFIAFLDADDAWLPGKLEQQLRLFAAHPTAALLCEASLFWYSWKDPKAEDVFVAVGVPGDRLYRPAELFRSLYPFGNGAPPCPSGIMVRRTAFDRSGGFEEIFSGEYGLYEDQAFLAKFYLRENVFVSARANNLYRKRPGSMTDTLKDLTLYNKVRLFFLDWLKHYMQDHSISDPELTGLVETAQAALARPEGIPEITE